MIEGSILFSIGLLIGGFAVHFLYATKAMQPNTVSDDIDSELEDICDDEDEDILDRFDKYKDLKDFDANDLRQVTEKESENALDKVLDECKESASIGRRYRSFFMSPLDMPGRDDFEKLLEKGFGIIYDEYIDGLATLDFKISWDEQLKGRVFLNKSGALKEVDKEEFFFHTAKLLLKYYNPDIDKEEKSA